MRRLLPLLLLCALACKGSEGPPVTPPAVDGPRPIPPGLWKPSLKGVPLPSTPLTGALGGAGFVPDRVRFDAKRGKLIFSEGDGRAPARQIIVFLFDIPTDRLSIVPDAGGKLPQVHLWWTVDDKGTRESDALFGGYSLELEFPPAPDGKTRQGKIYLCLPDAERSALAGSFDAELVD